MTRFFIARLSSLGDVVCSLPAAVALKRSFPASEIVWAVDPRFRGVVDACASVNTVVEARPSAHPRSWGVAVGRFDAALDLQGLFKSAILVARCQAKRKVGYHWQREGAWLWSEKVLPDPTSFHVVDQYVDVARSLGAELHRAEFDLRPPSEAVESVKAKLAAAGVEGDVIAMNAGAGWATKRWPAAHFSQLCNMVADLRLTPVFLGGGGPQDRDAFEEVCEGLPSRPVDLLGQTSVPELIALIAQSKAHVGGDTGSTHIAAALGIPAIGLYSITHPRRSCPYGQIERCVYDPEGLAHIRPEAVAEKLAGALS